MAKKIYHIPLNDVRVFIKLQKETLNKLLSDTKQLHYMQVFGKSYYELEIESFIDFFKMNKNLSFALQTINYLNSKNFLEEIYTLLNFKQFEIEKAQVNKRDFFYAFCYILQKNDRELFGHLLRQLFIHFKATINSSSAITINHKEMVKELAKSKNITIKESFGEYEDGSYFKLFIDDEKHIDLQGNSIKTLRKKGYKKLFYLLLDMNHEDALLKKKEEAYRILSQMK